jgi:hypothetical protein
VALGRHGLLLDSTILANAVTHTDAWIDTGTKLWGGKIPVPTGYAARVPVHTGSNNTREYRDVCFLTGLTYLARAGRLRLFTSAELMAEQDRHPPARFRPVGYSDMSLLDGITLESVDGWCFVGLVEAVGATGSAALAKLQRDRLAASDDALFKRLVRVLGPKHSQDAWHIRTAEAHGMLAFVTMDYALLRLVENQREKLNALGLTTWIVSPEELGHRLGMVKLPPHLFSYNNASFPVRPDLSWPGERRRSGKRPIFSEDQ